MYLRNTWYVAAWGSEIDHELRQITVLGEDICIFRGEQGGIIALEDACPHRKLPLSMGRRRGDAVECGYHGLVFDCAGSCIRGPVSTIPAGARVKSYPVVERYGMAWIWMGDPALADPASIIHIPEYDDPSWGRNSGPAIDLDCNYLLVTDNLLDPTHVAYVHVTSFGQSATRDTPIRVTKTEDGVAVWRWMLDCEVAPFYRDLVQFNGNCDRLQHWEIRYPALAIIKAQFCPAGEGGPDKPLHADTFIMDSYNFITPVDETRSRYYYFQLRNIRPEDDALSEAMSKGVKGAFSEDVVVLGAVQKMMARSTTPMIDLEIDAGPLRFRRGLKARIAEERAAAEAPARASAIG